MDIIKILQEHSDKVEKQRPSISSENDTKDLLVRPFLKKFLFDKMDPWKTSLEFTDSIESLVIRTIEQTKDQYTLMRNRYLQMKETTQSHPYMLYYNPNPQSYIALGVTGKAVRVNDPNLRIPTFHAGCYTTISPMSERDLAREGIELYTDAKALYDMHKGIHGDFDYHPDKMELDMNKYNPTPDNVLRYVFANVYPPILIECKTLGTDIENEKPMEMKKYFNGTCSVLGIHTNGDTYKIYSNDEIDEPIFKFRMTDMSNENILSVAESFLQLRKRLP